jgi:protoporphyrinogen oxidase
VANKIVISGAGITGLVSALLLLKKHEGEDIYLVDKNQEAGGLLRRFDYGPWGSFDYGMHNMLQTGITEMDELLWGLLPPEEWQLLNGNKRDLAGIFFNGRLQKNSPYIDLRSLPKRDYETCITALWEHFAGAIGSEHSTPSNFEEFAHFRFGEIVSNKTIIPSIEKIFKKKASELDYKASRLTPLDRLTLPLDRSSGRNAFYPVKYGIYRIVDSIIDRLQKAGVNLLLGSEIKGIECTNGRITSIQTEHAGKASKLGSIERLIWTSNIGLLGRFLGLDFTGMRYDKPLNTVVVNLVLDRLPDQMEDLYYFFCYDDDYHTYRITNFANYCKGAYRNGGYPLSIELLMEDDSFAGCDLEKLAIEEFTRLQIGSPETKVLFAKAEVLQSGFPMPTTNNISSIREIRSGTSDLDLQNLSILGILAKDDLFFQTDVLSHLFDTINELYE